MSISGLNWLLTEFANSLEKRVLATVFIFLVVGFGGYFGVPIFIRRFSNRLTDFASDYLENHFDTESLILEYVSGDVEISQIATATGQSILSILSAFGLVIVWGRNELALRVVWSILQFIPEFGQVTATIVLFAITYAAFTITDSSLDDLAERDRWNKHQAGIVLRTIQVCILIVAGISFLSIWNINVGGLLVGAGFLGIIVGMATRQTIAALLAGFVLMFSRPFELGDWVEIGEEEGVVVDITMVNTRLENLDGEMVVIPNDKIGERTVKNKTAKGRLRITMEVSVDYDSDPREAVDVAKDAMKRVDEVVAIPNPQAVPVRFGDSGIVLELRYWIDNPSARRRARAKTEVIQEVKTGFDRNGISIPYPQRKLSLRDSSGSDSITELSDFGD